MATKEDKRKLFGQILLEKELVSKEQIKEALEIQDINGKALGDILVDLEYATNSRITEVLSDYLGMEVVSIKNVDFKENILDKIPHSIAQLYRIVPIAFEESTITVAPLSMTMALLSIIHAALYHMLFQRIELLTKTPEEAPSTWSAVAPNSTWLSAMVQWVMSA